MKNILRKFSIFLMMFPVLLVASNCYGSLEILNFRHWTAPDHTRIVFDVSGKPDYKIRKIKNKLILNIHESSINKNIKRSIILNKPGIKKINFHQVNKKNVRIEFFLGKHQNIEVFKLKKFQDRPDRIVVDIIIEEIHKEKILKPSLFRAKKKRIIIIDPGHGGEDPGAIGKKGTYEKSVVLFISRKIQNEINKMPGYRAVLTRRGDYYVSFSKRLQKARDLQASLFISVHADAARRREAKGSSVYCLSTGAASNEAAKLLAHNENLSDIFGGVTDIESSNESNPIIMNMFQTNTINLSKTYAETLIKHLNMVNHLKYEIVQEAPFRVLKLPDIPAVLIETAYISNPQEERLLKNSNFQKNLAMAIASSIKDYFAGADNAISGEGEITTTEYEIKKGDTLFSVAGNFNTKVGVLLQLNNMKMQDTLFVGQVIIVPTDKTDNEDEGEGTNINIKQSEKMDKSKNKRKPSKFYTVKKGDTLFIIAQKNSTTLKELLKINNMKITDKLLYGQKIKIP
ncbi:MAG: N-acetylmuramoyl-L-alanine amidase [Syntrophaceae bacterium]|nr:N-acetylmuramoyl-L-alanine amidase [Syntrophaceae bacterium]